MVDSGLGSIGSGLYSLFGENDPQDAAWPYLNKIPDMLNGLYQPYIQNGQAAFGSLNNYMTQGTNANNTLMGQYNNLISNPTGTMNQIGSTFHSSPGYNWDVNQALGAANRASAAGGMAGSPAEQQTIGGTVNQMANQDYYNYLNHGIGMYNQGLQGMEGVSSRGLAAGTDVYNTGANMSNELAQNLASTYLNQANLGYQGTINTNQRIGGGLGSIWGGMGQIFDPGSSMMGQGGGGAWGGSQGGGQGGGGGSSGGGSSGMNLGALASILAMFF